VSNAPHHPGRSPGEEFGLKKCEVARTAPIRNILARVFREPIICKNVPRLVPGWTKRLSSAVTPRRPVPRYRLQFPGKGTLTMKFRRRTDGKVIEREVYKSPSAGVALAMYNLDDSIADFARASLNQGLSKGYSVYLSTKNTTLKVYDGRFKTSSRRSTTRNSGQVRGEEDHYEHRLIDDMVAAAMKWSGGYVGLQELRRRRAVRHHRAGLRLARA